MAKRNTKISNNIIYLIYDGDCILCNNCAKALKIKNSVGELQTINARTNHQLVNEVISRGYDLNEGIIVKYNDKYYYGADAVQLLALLSSPVNLFNKLNAFIFKFTSLSSIFYPIFKLIRKLLLWLRRTPKIVCSNQAPIGQIIWDFDCEKILPKIFYMRYSNLIFNNNAVTVSGTISIHYSKFFTILSPLFRLMGALAPYSEVEVPVTVKFSRNEQSKKININRVFYFSKNKSYKFNSYLLPIKDNIVVEFIKYRLGWRSRFSYDNNKIKMTHYGYVFRIFNLLIPLPLSVLIGKCYAEEEAMSDTEFKMLMKFSHPLFGELFQYQGQFKIVEPLCLEKF